MLLTVRSRCGLLRLLLSLLVLVACEGPRRPRNLILLSIETLRADHLGIAGHPEAHTPNLDRLLASGTYFTQAITPLPRTTPALASLLTGLAPHHHGSREVTDPIRHGVLLAELLRERGFFTAAVVGNQSAGPRQGLDRGFDRFVTALDLEREFEGRLYRDNTDVPPTARGWAAVTNAKVADVLAGAPEDQPLFLWLFYFDPHFLYRPPEPWNSRIPAPKCRELYARVAGKPWLGGKVFNNIGEMSRPALDDCRRLYDGEIAYLDGEVGQLLRMLDEAGRLDDALVVVTADHGENFGEGGLYFEHGENAHDAGLRIPLGFSGPGIAAGRREGGAVSLLDVMPTVLAQLGIPGETQPRMDGDDLSARFSPSATRRAEEERRIVFAESASALFPEAFSHVVTGRMGGRVCWNGPRYTLCENPGAVPNAVQLFDHLEDVDLQHDLASTRPADVKALLEVRRRWPAESARFRVARTARFKLVESPKGEGGYVSTLHDLAADPREEVDVGARFPDVRRQLEEALRAWFDTAPGWETLPRDPERERVMRALGYIE